MEWAGLVWGQGCGGRGEKGGSKLWLGTKFVIWRAMQGKGGQVGEEGVGWGRGQQLAGADPEPSHP